MSNSNKVLKSLRVKSSLTDDFLPGVEAIGLGYNPFISYATVEGGTFQLFDWVNSPTKPVTFKKGFVVPSIVDVQQEDGASYTNVTGSSITKYQKSLATSTTVEGSYNYFSGSLSADYEENSLRNAENEFTRIQQSINMWSFRMPSVPELRALMLPHMRDRLDQLNYNNPDDINTFFDNFGSHFLTGIVMGGRAVYAASTNKLQVDRSYSIDVTAKASYEGLTGQLSAENRTKYAQSMASFTQNSNTHQEVRGGSGVKAQSAFSGKEGFAAWTESVGESPDFVDFVPAIPMQEIWFLCQSAAQQKAMENHYHSIWAPNQSNRYKIHPNYIDDIIVISGGHSDIQPPDGYTKINYDLNKGAGGDYIYLCYHEEGWQAENPKQGVIEIRILYGNDPTPSGFIKLPQDLNKGAGGEYVYLCFRRGPNPDEAMNKLTVIGGGNADIPPPYGYQKIPRDLNKGAGGEYIFLCTFTQK